MDSYKAQGMSRKDIRKVIRFLRKLFQMESVQYFPIVRFLEYGLPMLFPNFQLEIVAKSEMGNKHGETFPSSYLIRIREDVYEGAVKGNLRDRMTIAHEIGHLFLHGNRSIALCRLEPGERIRPYEDPEWQTDAFAGELLAPSYLIRGLSIEEVNEEFGVSVSAARVQLRSLRR